MVPDSTVAPGRQLPDGIVNR